MKKAVNIDDIYPKHFFWDMDYDKLDLDRDKDIIIPRALYFTDKNSFTKDISKLETLYTPQLIVQYLQKTKELISNEVCEMVAKRYHIPLFHRFSSI